MMAGRRQRRLTAVWTMGLVAWAMISRSAPLSAADRICSLSVVNRLDQSRAGEMVELDWSGLQDHFPRERADAVEVVADGTVIPSQVIRASGNRLHDKLIFQADFAPRQTRRFTIRTTGRQARHVKPRTHAIFVEHADLNFLAWENDRIAFRLYGPLCEKTLVSSGVDVWAKGVARPVLDTMCRRNYHLDNGEGVDCYTTGKGRGCGGLGVWKDGKLHVSRNFKTWKIVTGGPLRVVLETTYEPWDAGGLQVGEVKRITLDAGAQLSRIESTLHFAGEDRVAAAVGLGVPKGTRPAFGTESGWAAVWQGTDGKGNGMLGVGMVASRLDQVRFTQAADHVLMLQPAIAGQTLVYYAGAGWSKYGFADAAAWNAYLDAFARRLASPLEIRW